MLVVSFCILYRVDPIILDFITLTAISSNAPFVRLTNFKAVINLCNNREGEDTFLGGPKVQAVS